MTTKRWYVYEHKGNGGLATSLLPPLDNPNADEYNITGPYENTEIVDRFMELHNAKAKAKRERASGAEGGGDLVGQDGAE